MGDASLDIELLRAANDAFDNDVEYMATALSEELVGLQNARVLITGGAGFLGYYLTQTVLHWNRNHSSSQRINLILLDSFVRGIPTWIKDIHIEPSVQTITKDISTADPSQLPSVDYIFHAASIASPVVYRRHPIETMDANVRGIRNLLDHCLADSKDMASVQGLVFFSSSEIYGDPDDENIPTTEEYWGHVSCTGPRSSYDESKRYGETLCVNFSQEYDLPIRIVRPFNNFGPGMALDDGRVVSDIAKNILNHEDVCLFSDGKTTRTFCYISDAIVGYYKVLLNGRSGHPYNIGSETPEITIEELAEMMITLSQEMFGYSGKVTHRQSVDQNYNRDSPLRRCPSIERARLELGFSPKMQLGEGLRRTLLWYWRNYEHRSGRLQ